MKFSVLLPTRNRLHYLRYAVETVRRQDYDDWEIVISDNFSEEDIAGYVRSLDEPRIKYSRTERFVPVTENWNRALDQCSGDYITMLGDDDGLLQGYFRRLDELIRQFGPPDFLYTGAYLFAYPGVLPHAPQGFFQSYDYADFLRRAKRPYLLPRTVALEAVKAALEFRATYGFNMQFVAVSRDFVRSLKTGGPFYEAPFPDYYAMNVMFLRARRILVCPDLMVAIGVTPKSYGYFHSNNLEASGMEFLNGNQALSVPAHVRPIILPGTNINTSWLLSLEAIKSRHGSDLPRDISYGRYRMLQIIEVLRGCLVERTMPTEVLGELQRRLSRRERLIFNGLVQSLFSLASRLGSTWRRRTMRLLNVLMGQYPWFRPARTIVGYKDMLEAFEKTPPQAARP